MITIEFDKKLTCGPEFIAVRILENCEDLQVGNIWLLQKAEANTRLAFAIVEDVGLKAAEEYGLKIGDYIMFDRLSTFAHTSPVAAMRYNNAICLTNKDKSEYWPLKNMLFVEPDEKEEMTKINNIYVQGYANKLNVGTITKMNCEESLKLPFKEGDKVMMTKGADYVQFGEKKLYIYKHDMIVAKIDD